MNKSVLLSDVERFASSFPMIEPLRHKTFLITGATGLIGTVMTRCLLELSRQHHLDIRVIAIVRNVEKARLLFADVFDQIIFYELQLFQITKESITHRADYVVHLASPTASKYFVTNPVETLRTSFEGVVSMLEYARQSEVLGMVYVSSLEVYGVNENDEWIDEDFQGYVNPTEVRSSYNIGKRASECLCCSYEQEYNVPVVIARLTQTFGAGVSESENRVFAQFAHNIIRGKDIELHTEGISAKPYCYTTDAVSAIIYLLVNGTRGTVYNVANKSTYISIRDMAMFVRQHFNPDIKVTHVPCSADAGYAPSTRLRLDTSKLESLGWRPQYDLEAMFRNLINYLK